MELRSGTKKNTPGHAKTNSGSKKQGGRGGKVSQNPKRTILPETLSQAEANASASAFEPDARANAEDRGSATVMESSAHTNFAELDESPLGTTNPDDVLESHSASSEHLSTKLTFPKFSGGQSASPKFSGTLTPQKHVPKFSGGQSASPKFSDTQKTNPKFSDGQSASPKFSGGHFHDPKFSDDKNSSPEFSGTQKHNPKFSGGQSAPPKFSGGQKHDPKFSDPISGNPKQFRATPEAFGQISGTQETISGNPKQFRATPEAFGQISGTKGPISDAQGDLWRPKRDATGVQRDPRSVRASNLPTSQSLPSSPQNFGRFSDMQDPISDPHGQFWRPNWAATGAQRDPRDMQAENKPIFHDQGHEPPQTTPQNFGEFLGTKGPSSDTQEEFGRPNWAATGVQRDPRDMQAQNRPIFQGDEPLHTKSNHDTMERPQGPKFFPLQGSLKSLLTKIRETNAHERPQNRPHEAQIGRAHV